MREGERERAVKRATEREGLGDLWNLGGKRRKGRNSAYREPKNFAGGRQE